MRAVLQRVTRARVLVDGEQVGAIGKGWAILLGIGPRDDEASAAVLVDKIVKLRAFEDANGKMNVSAEDLNAEILVVSQFTLYADLSHGRRPSFVGAAPPGQAERLVGYVEELFRQSGLRVEAGRFGAMMDVDLVNSGPVTFVLSTDGWD